MARMLRYCWPLVQSPLPSHACSATPMVVIPRSICLESVRIIFWLGPWVCWVLIVVPIFSFTRLAHTCPYTKKVPPTEAVPSVSVFGQLGLGLTCAETGAARAMPVAAATIHFRTCLMLYIVL